MSSVTSACASLAPKSRATARSASRPRSGTPTRSPRTGRLQPGQQRHEPGHRHPVLATPALQAFSSGTGTAQHARQGVHERIAEFQRALRIHRQAVHALRVLEAGMSRADFGCPRNSVAINAPPIDTSNSSPYLIRRRERCGHGLQLRLRCRSGLRGPRANGSRQLRPVVRSSISTAAAPSRWACSTSGWKTPWPTAARP